MFPLALEQDSRGPARPSPIVSPRLGRLLCHRAQVPWRAGRPRERSPGKWQRFPGGFLVKPRELWPLFLPRFKKASLKGGRALARFEVTAWGCPTSPTRLSVWRQAWDTAFISFFELQHRCKALYEGWGQGVLTSESAVASLPVGGVWVKGPGGGGGGQRRSRAQRAWRRPGSASSSLSPGLACSQPFETEPRVTEHRKAVGFGGRTEWASRGGGPTGDPVSPP